jgi:hypothetical protein
MNSKKAADPNTAQRIPRERRPSAISRYPFPKVFEKKRPMRRKKPGFSAAGAAVGDLAGSAVEASGGTRGFRSAVSAACFFSEAARLAAPADSREAL